MGKKATTKKVPQFTAEQRAAGLTRPHIEIPDGPTLMVIQTGPVAKPVFSCWWIAPDGTTEKRLSKKDFPDCAFAVDAIEDIMKIAELWGHEVREPDKPATANDRTTKGTKDAKDGKGKADGVCESCGAVGTTTISVKIPGMKGTPAICQTCMQKALEQVGSRKPGGKERGADLREVTGVKIAPDPLLVTIGYDQPHGEDKISVTVESKDEPKDSLKAALQALCPHAVAMCEIPVAWEAGAEVRSVKIKHADAGVGVVITCVKELSTGQVCCLNTPYTVENNEHGAQLTDEAAVAVDKLMAEALKYVDGNRAQGSLFKDDGK